MAAEFLKAFPMLEDVLIESWQEGMGTGNPYTHRVTSAAQLSRAPTAIAEMAASMSSRTYQNDSRASDHKGIQGAASDSAKEIFVCLPNQARYNFYPGGSPPKVTFLAAQAPRATQNKKVTITDNPLGPKCLGNYPLKGKAVMVRSEHHGS